MSVALIQRVRNSRPNFSRLGHTAVPPEARPNPWLLRRRVKLATAYGRAVKAGGAAAGIVGCDSWLRGLAAAYTDRAVHRGGVTSGLPAPARLRVSGAMTIRLASVSEPRV